MPGGVNGRELAEQLSKKRPDMKILYMSGYTNNAIAKHGLLDNDAAFLQKPFTLRALSTKARQVLDS
jgi:DNA-binding NtrC family response regulator